MGRDLRELWPINLMPEKDELLSSWMIRNAHNHKQKIHTFYKVGFGTSININSRIWNIDIDRNPRMDIIELLTKKTVLCYDEIVNCSLKCFEGRLFESISRVGNNKWILPQGHYHTKNTRNGLLYCPSCLSNDKIPYFRKQWRLSISFCCVSCNSILMERCWNCGSGVNFIRTELGKKNDFNLNKVYTCHKCQSDLRRCKQLSCGEELQLLQNKLYQYLYSGHTENLNYSHLYFDVLYQICSILLSLKSRAWGFQLKVAKECGITFKPMLDDGESSFDYLDTRIRADVLTMAIWILDEWPERFLKVMKDTKSGLTLQYLNCSAPVKLPYWYSSINYSPGPFRNYPGSQHLA